MLAEPVGCVWGRAQLHPSAAPCLPLSGVLKFQPWRHPDLGWGLSAPTRPHLQGSPGCSTLWELGPCSTKVPRGRGEEKLGGPQVGRQRRRHRVFRVWRHLE